MYNGYTEVISPARRRLNIMTTIREMGGADHLTRWLVENRLYDLPEDEQERRLKEEANRLYVLANDNDTPLCDCNGANRWGCKHCQPVTSPDDIPF